MLERSNSYRSFIDRIRTFARERDWEQYHSPKNLSIALIVEVAELVEQFQWLTEEQSRELPPEKMSEIKDEIGDVLIYLMKLSDQLGIDPLQAAEQKLEKNAQKYPADKVRGSAKKYTEYDK